MADRARRFEDLPAARQRVPLLIGLVGPSGSGKTYSMLRLLAGIESETGGGYAVIDTEANRALWYADKFKQRDGKPFRHLNFQAPFGPLDYLAAIQHFASQGIKNIGIDSMSHEHEGPGGVLEMHEAELDRLAGQDWQKRERVKFLAWAKPKSERRRLVNSLLQMNCNLVFCFRAKEKLKLERGKEPLTLGWMPIAGEEFVYEMSLNLLLPPGGQGVPDLNPKEIGEKAILKVPGQFAKLLTPGKPLDEKLGAELAKWAAGDEAPGSTAGWVPTRQPATQQPTQEDNTEALAAARTQLQRLPKKEDRQAAMQAHWAAPHGAVGGWKAITAMESQAIRAGAASLARELDGLEAMKTSPFSSSSEEPKQEDPEPIHERQPGEDD